MACSCDKYSSNISGKISPRLSRGERKSSDLKSPEKMGTGEGRVDGQKRGEDLQKLGVNLLQGWTQLRDKDFPGGPGVTQISPCSM